jgi:hypothetical protein
MSYRQSTRRAIKEEIRFLTSDRLTGHYPKMGLRPDHPRHARNSERTLRRSLNERVALLPTVRIRLPIR